MSLFLALLLHPEVQRKAQDEIDAVTGRKRLPTFEDRPSLPFIDALCKEVIRWRPPAPLRASYQQSSYIRIHIYDILHRCSTFGHGRLRV